jgi:hypothetical protein
MRTFVIISTFLQHYLYSIQNIPLLTMITITTLFVFVKYADSVIEYFGALTIHAMPMSWVSLLGEGNFKINLYLITSIILFCFVLKYVVSGSRSVRAWISILIVLMLISLQIVLNSTQNGILGAFVSLTLLPTFVAFLLLINFVEKSHLNKKVIDPERILNIFVSTGCGVAIFVIFQAYNLTIHGVEFGYIFQRSGRISLGALFYDFTIFSGFLILTLIGSVALCMRVSSLRTLTSNLAIIAIILIAVVLTGSRAGAFALIFGFFGVSIIRIRELLKKPLIAISFMLLGVVLIIFILNFLSYSRVSLSDEGFWDDTRASGWLFWIKQFAAGNIYNWIFGFGLDYSSGAYLKGFKFSSHNVFIDALLTGGMLLLIAITVFLTFVLISLNGLTYNLFFQSGLAIMMIAPSVLQARIFGIYALIIVIFIIGKKKSENHTHYK